MRPATAMVLVAACAAAVCAAPGHNDTRRSQRTLDQAEAGSERLSLVSQSGWRPLILTGGGGGPRGQADQPQRLPRTPTYAAPPSAGDFRPADGPREDAKGIKDAVKRDAKGRDAQGDDQRDARRNVVAFEGSPSPPPSTPRAKKHQAPTDGPPRPPPWADAGLWAGPWAGQRVTPISEPDNDAEPVLGYRYPPPAPPVLGPGPSPTAPFWEAAWLRRRERLLQELGLAAPPGFCRCVPLPDGCGGFPGYPAGPAGPAGSAGYDGGYSGRYRLADPADAADLHYRLGVGAYGLYGWSRPLHNHNSAPLPLPLGTSRLHDSPN